MLFVSRLFPYKVYLQHGASRYEFIPDQNKHQEIVLRPTLAAEFRRGIIAFAAREAARDFFDDRFGSENGDPPGPYRRAGIASDPDFEGFTYDGSDSVMGYSQFDTDTDCPTGVQGMTDEEVRAFFEAKLLAHPDRHAGDFILIEQPRVATPWPAYDTIILGGKGITEAVVAKRIVETAEAIGASLPQVAAYERENQNREYVLVALEESARRQHAEQAEIEALSA